MSAFTGDYLTMAEAVGDTRLPYESHTFCLSEEDGLDPDAMEIIGMITAQDKLNKERYLAEENANLRKEIQALRERLGEPSDWEDYDPSDDYPSDY